MAYKPTKELRKIQMRSLEIMIKLDSFFKEHGIQYSLVAGTAIGAIVHKGFIPWDDDIDIAMDRRNYEKFLAIMRQQEFKISDDLQVLNYRHDGIKNIRVLISKVVDVHTNVEYLTQYNEVLQTGIFVDITVFDKVSNNLLIRRIQLFASDLATLSINKYPPNNRGKLMKLLCSIYLRFTGEKTRYRVCKLCERVYASQSMKTGCMYTEYVFTKLNRLWFPAELFDQLISTEFENHQFPIFQNYDAYLRKRYSDAYTELPPDEEQVPHHHYIKVNLCKRKEETI